MNILFDLVHPADINLFKQTIYSLKKDGHTILITLRIRGRIKRIANKEFPDLHILIVGKHREKLIRKVLAYIRREVSFLSILRKNKIDVAICMGLTFGFACKIRGVPLIHLDDDPEYKTTFLLGKYLSTKNIVPEYLNVDGRNFIKYHGFKELAYLHPEYFQPNPKALEGYNLIQFKYVFIREISSISTNYQQLNTNLIEIIQYVRIKGYEVILSLEDKSKQAIYKDYANIISEPIDNLHSLLYYSKFVISSGDTMARESAILGVPCIYSGGRNMAMNTILMKLNLLFKIDDIQGIREQVDLLAKSEDTFERRKAMRNHILATYDDLNQIIITQIKNLTAWN